jgi:nucleotide-binding universal stress UspA family protein
MASYEKNRPKKVKTATRPARHGMLAYVDGALSAAILILGIYMMALASTGKWGLIVPGLVFIVIGLIKVRSVIPVLLTSSGTTVERQLAFNRIIVPISRPETVESLVKLACDLLAKGGELRLVSIIEVPPQLPYDSAESVKGPARDIMKKAASYAHKLGVEAFPEIVSARLTSDAILSLQKSHNADLIVMGSSQRTMTQRMLFGNVVDRIVKDAPCEVIIFSYSEYPIKYDKILVPTSGYKHSQRSLDVAISLQSKFKGKLTSLFVGQESEHEKGEVILKKAKLHAERSGVDSDVILRTGNVVDAIIGVARDGNYTLIMIGSTERPSYYTVLLGSVADEIIKKAPCNVLVVRTKK